MSNLSLSRVLRAIKTYTANQLWTLREQVDERLADFDIEELAKFLGNPVIGAARIMMIQQHERIYAPYTDAMYHLKYLAEKMDDYASVFPDKELKLLLGKTFPMDLEETWKTAQEIAARKNVDLYQFEPEVATAIDERLEALRHFLITGDSTSLREIVKIKLNVEKLNIYKPAGRRKGLDQVTKCLGEFGYNEMSQGRTASEAVHEFIRLTSAKSDDDRTNGEKASLEELQKRKHPIHEPTHKEKLSSQEEYFRQCVKRYCNYHGLKVGRKLFDL